MEKEEVTLKPPRENDVIEIKVWRDKKLFIIKPLITLRIAQILWVGGGKILIIFFSVILKQRGLTVLEISYVFSVTFLFQFAFASISGIIVDRIGRAKPILLFLVLGTASAIICILLAPELRNTTCTEKGMSVTCYNSSGNFCKFCYENYKVHLNSRKSYQNLAENFTNSNVSENVNLIINDNGTSENNFDSFNISLTNNSCTENCSVLCKGFIVNSNECLIREKIVLAIYYALILSFFSFFSTANRLFDFFALSLAERYGSDFGKEAFIATFGELLIVAVAAFALNIETSLEKKNNYDIAYWCCTVVMILTFISVYYTKDVKIPPGRKLREKARELVRNLKTLVFILVVFVAGNGCNFNLHFHFWFLESLNTPKVIIGLHSLTCNFYGILVLFSSKWWIKRFGTEKILVLGLLSYAANDIGYSFLYNPWLSLLLEVTTIFSFHLIWIAFVIHCKRTAPEGLAATLIAIVGTVHFGIGRSTAILGGGVLVNYFGLRIAYRIFACVFLITAILYSIFLCIPQFEATEKSKNNGDEAEEMKHMNHSKEQEI